MTNKLNSMWKIGVLAFNAERTTIRAHCMEPLHSSALLNLYVFLALIKTSWSNFWSPVTDPCSLWLAISTRKRMMARTSSFTQQASFIVLSFWSIGIDWEVNGDYSCCVVVVVLVVTWWLICLRALPAAPENTWNWIKYHLLGSAQI